MPHGNDVSEADEGAGLDALFVPGDFVPFGDLAAFAAVPGLLDIMDASRHYASASALERRTASN